MVGQDTTTQTQQQQQQQQLQVKVNRLQETVRKLTKTIENLTNKKTVERIDYDLDKSDERLFKLFSYGIKSISSIYIYILLGDEYEKLYKEIEKLLDVDPFQQQRNYDKFRERIQSYPNLTNKTTIDDIFLYQNQDIGKIIQTIIKKDDSKNFLEFLETKNCTHFNYYLSFHQDQYINSLISLLYLDKYKDEESLENNIDRFKLFLEKEFKITVQDADTFLTFDIGDYFSDLSEKRFRNYSFLENYLPEGNIKDIIYEKLQEKCS